MTGSQPDPHTSDDDLDPTGVRALLANLPDPGPMPDDLMARISQSLELEQERRAAAGPVGAPGQSGDPTTAGSPSGHGTGADGGTVGTTGGSVVSLDSERARRRPGRTVLWLGGAAAVAMVATVSVNQLVGGDNGAADVAANVPVTTDDVDSGAEAGGAGEDEAQGESDAEAPGAAPEREASDEETLGEPPPMSEQGAGDVDSTTRVYAAAGTIELIGTDWADQVSAWLTGDHSTGGSDWGAAQAVDCLSASDLDTGRANSVMLSQAMWAQEPATLVVAEAADGDTAWLLSPDCTEVLSGPAPLD